jgi:ATP-dependent exoDNAse (exonuclease V) beta subunit
MNSMDKDERETMVPSTAVQDSLKLACVHSHERDKKIWFEEKTHTYFIGGKCTGWASVTSVVHEFFDHFDAKKVASNIVKSQGFQNGTKYERYQVFRQRPDGSGARSQQECIAAIMESWEQNGKQAADDGTFMHNTIEKYYNDVLLTAQERELPEFRQHFGDFAVAAQMSGLQIYRTEWRVYCEEDMICGSIDAVFRDPRNGGFYLVDWKRTKSMRMRGFRRGTGPLSHLDDCNFIHYQIQLNLYQYILEKRYGIRVTGRLLVVCHPRQKTFQSYVVPERQAEILRIIKHRQTSKSKRTHD